MLRRDGYRKKYPPLSKREEGGLFPVTKELQNFAKGGNLAGTTGNIGV